MIVIICLQVSRDDETAAIIDDEADMDRNVVNDTDQLQNS